jgi:putative transposase
MSKYNPILHHRRSIRLKGYDYSQAGAYFVTMVTQDRECQFGEVAEDNFRPDSAGEMIARWWQELPNKFPSVELDECVIMPNHFHGIIVIVEDKGSKEGEHGGSPQQRPHAPLSQIIQWFKTMTTNEYIRGVKQCGWPQFRGKLWQRNYYEHVIRGESELELIRKYIAENPVKWALDQENPFRQQASRANT